MASKTLILIPSYEPDITLLNVVKQLKENNFDILVINDGSDSSYDSIFKKVEEECYYAKLQNNMGKGVALKSGFYKIKNEYHSYEYIITVDGDGQHNIKDILALNEMLSSKDEIVIGTRKFDIKIPFRSKFGNDLSKFSRGSVTKRYLHDDQCGLRGFPRRYLDELISINGERYEYEMNVIMNFQMKEYLLLTMPIETIYIEKNASSHFSPVKDTIKIQKVILSYYGPALINFVISFLSVTLLNIFCSFLNAYLISSIAFTLGFIFGYIILFLKFESKNPKKRFIKELIYFLLRFVVFAGIFALFFSLIKLNILASFFIAFIISTFSNFLFSFIFRK